MVGMIKITLTLPSRIDVLPAVSVLVGKMSYFYLAWCPNKRGGGKDESFLISVVSGISMLERTFRPLTVIKRRTK